MGDLGSVQDVLNEIKIFASVWAADTEVSKPIRKLAKSIVRRVDTMLKSGSKEIKATIVQDLDPKLYASIEDPNWWSQDPRIAITFMKKTVKPLKKILERLETIVKQ